MTSLHVEPSGAHLAHQRPGRGRLVRPSRIPGDHLALGGQPQAGLDGGGPNEDRRRDHRRHEHQPRLRRLITERLGDAARTPPRPAAQRLRDGWHRTDDMTLTDTLAGRDQVELVAVFRHYGKPQLGRSPEVPLRALGTGARDPRTRRTRSPSGPERSSRRGTAALISTEGRQQEPWCDVGDEEEIRRRHGHRHPKPLRYGGPARPVLRPRAPHPARRKATSTHIRTHVVELDPPELYTVARQACQTTSRM